MQKISVIIPCLNMVKYIRECLESIVNQTLHELEILLIDAGSEDGTLDIIDEYIKTDKRVRVIHSLKRSYGYQVNLGMEEALGQYIAIVDADDRIAVDMYEILYEHAIQSEADYVKGTARMFFSISENVTYHRRLRQFANREYTDGKKVLVPKDRPDLLTRDNFLWYGIFRRDFMTTIRLHESPGAAFQDFGGLLQTQIKAKKAVYLEQPFYEYRQDNMTASGYNPKGFQFLWEEYTWAEQFIRDVSLEWKAAFYRKLFLHTLDRYTAMSVSDELWEGAASYIERITSKLRAVLADQIIKESDFTAGEWKTLQLLLVDPNIVHKEYHMQYVAAKQQLIDMAKDIEGREVVVFGCGAFGQFVHAQILQHKMGKVVAYCDNKPDIKEASLDGIPVFTPAEAVRVFSDACFITAGKNYCEQMREQLIEMGINQEQIFGYTADLDMKLFGNLT